jgi:hypothetical protein
VSRFRGPCKVAALFFGYQRLDALKLGKVPKCRSQLLALTADPGAGWIKCEQKILTITVVCQM